VHVPEVLTSSATLSVNAESAPFDATYADSWAIGECTLSLEQLRMLPRPTPGHSGQDGERPGDGGEEIDLEDPTVERCVPTHR
jgi:hypothetical protein